LESFWKTMLADPLLELLDIACHVLSWYLLLRSFRLLFIFIMRPIEILAQLILQLFFEVLIPPAPPTMSSGLFVLGTLRLCCNHESETVGWENLECAGAYWNGWIASMTPNIYMCP
jgi:hypothetical protein